MGDFLHGKKVIQWVIVAVVVAGVAFLADYRRQLVDAREFDRRVAVLNREHDERQRDVEANLGKLEGVVADAVQSVDRAGEIVERTGGELQSAAAGLRSAKEVLGDLAVQFKDLQSELDRCRADLHRLGGLVGVGVGSESE
jgi:hypothetical protein